MNDMPEDQQEYADAAKHVADTPRMADEVPTEDLHSDFKVRGTVTGRIGEPRAGRFKVENPSIGKMWPPMRHFRVVFRDIDPLSGVSSARTIVRENMYAREGFVVFNNGPEYSVHTDVIMYNRHEVAAVEELDAPDHLEQSLVDKYPGLDRDAKIGHPDTDEPWVAVPPEEPRP